MPKAPKGEKRPADVIGAAIMVARPGRMAPGLLPHPGETLLLNAGVPMHVVAARCGHDPAVLLRNLVSAASVIGSLSKEILGR
jgi:hypothetical protein